VLGIIAESSLLSILVPFFLETIITSIICPLCFFYISLLLFLFHYCSFPFLLEEAISLYSFEGNSNKLVDGAAFALCSCITIHINIFPPCTAPTLKTPKPLI
jgi:hypothetical protein